MSAERAKGPGWAAMRLEALARGLDKSASPGDLAAAAVRTRPAPPCAMCKWFDKFGTKPVGTWGAFKFCPARPKCKPDATESAR